MHRDDILRRALWATAGFNTLGALAFAWPATLGQLAGLPAEAPVIYRAAMAFLVGLLGATYAWMALQPRIDRPLVGFAMFGKAGFFLVVVACWLGGEAPFLGVFTAAGDLAFAILFGWWLVAGGAPAQDPLSGPGSRA